MKRDIMPNHHLKKTCIQREQKIKFWVQLLSHEPELPETSNKQKEKKVYIFKQLQLLSSLTVCINVSQKSKVSSVASSVR